MKGLQSSVYHCAVLACCNAPQSVRRLADRLTTILALPLCAAFRLCFTALHGAAQPCQAPSVQAVGCSAGWDAAAAVTLPCTGSEPGPLRPLRSSLLCVPCPADGPYNTGRDCRGLWRVADVIPSPLTTPPPPPLTGTAIAVPSTSY